MSLGFFGHPLHFMNVWCFVGFDTKRSYTKKTNISDTVEHSISNATRFEPFLSYI